MYLECNAVECQHLRTCIFPRTDRCALQDTYRTSEQTGLHQFLRWRKRKYFLAFRIYEFSIAQQEERNEFLKRLILRFSFYKFSKRIQHTLCILSHYHCYNSLSSVAMFQNVFHRRSFARVILKN